MATGCGVVFQFFLILWSLGAPTQEPGLYHPAVTVALMAAGAFFVIGRLNDI